MLSLVVALIAAPIWAGAQAQLLTLQTDRCLTDDEVTAKDRKPFGQAALRFAEDLRAAKLPEAYEQLTKELKQAAAKDRFTATVQSTAPYFNGLGSLSIAHSYVVTSSGWKVDHSVSCSAVAHGPAKALQDKVFVSASPIPKQVHIILEGQAPNNAISIALWLQPDPTDWRIQGFHITATTMAGKSAADFVAMAREQHRKGHAFSAAILLSGASELAYRGRYFELGTWREIQKELKDLPLPEELRGKPPFNWQFGMNSFRVLAIGPRGAGGKLALFIRREAKSADDSKLLDDENRLLIREFAQGHPDYAEVFEAVVVEAVEPHTGKGFRTVEDTHKSP